MILTLHNHAQAKGTVVVIDVLTAYTTSSLLFHKGAKQIYLMKDESLAIRTKGLHPEVMIFGERGGCSIKGFDEFTSPSKIDKKYSTVPETCILRTSSGVKGALFVSKNPNVKRILLGSFTTIEALRHQVLKDEEVCYLITGSRSQDEGLEDIALAKCLQGSVTNKEAHQLVLNSFNATVWKKGSEDPAWSVSRTNEYPFYQEVTDIRENYLIAEARYE